ncbi:MAG: gfo/Idh/MocA family oxidoreductase, partial [Verrucomicrobia bacterium]|nr:gfo/Idh/MocA family oxidoreductase [Verrucomicrobiota bacterium]
SQSGLLGNIKELHVWSNRPSWPQAMDRPAGSDPVPEGLDWDMWIGPAPMRPYKSAGGKGKKDTGIYNPFNWRGWLDFGTGALGDMACHTVNMPFRALQLGYPDEIEATLIGAMNQESYPLGSKIRFQFPKRGAAPHQGPVTLWWYDGGQPKKNNPHSHDGSNKPPRELLGAVEASRGEIPGSGCLIIGEKGQHFSGDAYGGESLLKLDGDKKYLASQKHPAAMAIPQTVPRNKFTGGADMQHHQEWIAAVKDNKPEACFSRFEIGAKLTEIMLLGCVALRVGKKIEWDGPGMRAKNAPEAARFIKRENRAGWEIKA